MLYPIRFHPIFKERVWGGRALEQLYRKELPPGAVIGESWEVTDRPEGVSVIAQGPLAGRSLRWLMERHTEELLGRASPVGGRFPLLVKILDAHRTLSVQVHPPAAVAASLGGEPKTEMWYVTAAQAEAELWVGLKHGVNRDIFERHLLDGSVAECLHRIPVRSGDAMFLPSGRVHALGAGSVIFEVQQNSDTTYRVFDWNRPGLDGRPRELQIPQSLACIDFSDHEPRLIGGDFERRGPIQVRALANGPLFSVEEHRAATGAEVTLPPPGWPRVIGLVTGRLRLVHAPTGQDLTLESGQFCVLPAVVDAVKATAESELTCLMVVAGAGP